jgi:hypothetical protein
MALEIKLQGFLHAFEQGRVLGWLVRLIVAIVIALLAGMWFGYKFNGFSDPAAMDQAQIGRQLATGQGLTTLYARPLAMNLMQTRRDLVPAPLPDISQAPLGPLLNAAVLRITGANAAPARDRFVSPAERAITAAAFCFFAGSLVLTYLLGRWLFDGKLALLGVGLVIVTDLVWRFTFSGLPQMAMLFFFTGALLALAGAMEAAGAERRGRAFLLVLVSSLLLGLMTLGHGIGLCIFAGFWIFAVAALRPRWLVALAAPAVYVLPLLPWAWHNWRAVRNPFGLPFYELYRPHGTDPLAWLADFEPLLRFHWTDFASNTAGQILDQATMLFSFLGGSIVAASFFLAVFFHVFRRWQAAQFRWAILLMWIAATAGMSIFGVGGAVSVNQMHVLFLPVMIFYGLAFLLVLWSRLEIEQPFLRRAFIVVLYIVSAVPLLGTVALPPPKVNWPPYLPPVIARFSQWVGPQEALAADIPWATAWYAGRTSLLLPDNIGQFELIHSEGLLRAPLVGIYLTPLSGNQAGYEKIINGPYREWARFILREIGTDDLSGWMLPTAINLPLEGQSIFYADRPRWR